MFEKKQGIKTDANFVVRRMNEGRCVSSVKLTLDKVVSFGFIIARNVKHHDEYGSEFSR